MFLRRSLEPLNFFSAFRFLRETGTSSEFQTWVCNQASGNMNGALHMGRGKESRSHHGQAAPTPSLIPTQTTFVPPNLIFPQETDLWRCFKCNSTSLGRFRWKLLSREHWWWLQLVSKFYPGTTCSWDLPPILPQSCKERIIAFGTFLMKFLARLWIILAHQERRLGATKSPKKSCWYLPRCFKLYHKIKYEELF